MSISIPMPGRISIKKRLLPLHLEQLDVVLLLVCITLLSLGFIMVGSASISVADRDLSSPFYYMNRQFVFTLLGIAIILVVYRVRLVQWEKSGLALLGFALFLLVLVLIPGIGKTVNGSTRWLSMGIVNIQVSEIVKLFLIIYVAGYLVRYGDDVRNSLWGFARPMIMVAIAGLLLLLEPDFGATVVIVATVFGMMYLGGVKFTWVIAFMGLFGGLASFVVLTSVYRMERMTSFMNPWADPFDSGFQLTQSLIAIGTGSMFGNGLGGSVQKLFYLPESHTDFVFAVLAEELGFVGVCVVILLYAILFFRAFKIGSNAEKSGNRFAAYLAYGIGMWLTMQAIINMGVNMGLLPTKGLTLPLMSYGGSSLIVSCLAIGLLLRIDFECRQNSNQATKKRVRKKSLSMKKAWI